MGNSESGAPRGERRRILCFGDLHLDAGANAYEDALADHEHVLEEIAALAGDCDLVLFAGDAFHRPHASDRARHVFRRFLSHLERQGVAFVGILGNASHDIYGTDRETALELFHDPARRVWISRHPEVIRVAGVDVCTLPSVQVARLAAANGGGDRGELFRHAAGALETIARGHLDHIAGSKAGPAVLLGHWSLTGTSLPNGLPVDSLNEPVLDTDALDEMGYAAMVFGHIHCGQRLRGATPGVYTGTPMCLDFGEAFLEHGVWILTLPDDPLDDAEFEFVPIAGRPFVTVDVDLAERDSDYADETDAIAGQITLPLDGAIVRVRYTATEEQHRRVDQAALRKLITDAGGRCHQIHPDIQRISRARAEQIDETLAPLQAVDAWCAANEIPTDTAAGLAELTTELLAEVAA